MQSLCFPYVVYKNFLVNSNSPDILGILDRMTLTDILLNWSPVRPVINQDDPGYIIWYIGDIYCRVDIGRRVLTDKCRLIPGGAWTSPSIKQLLSFFCAKFSFLRENFEIFCRSGHNGEMHRSAGPPIRVVNHIYM